jgi:hypothetical protein
MTPKMRASVAQAFLPLRIFHLSSVSSAPSVVNLFLTKHTSPLATIAVSKILSVVENFEERCVLN